MRRIGRIICTILIDRTSKKSIHFLKLLTSLVYCYDPTIVVLRSLVYLDKKVKY